MNPRYGLALATVLALGAAPALPATAKTVAKSCNLVSDDAGDAAAAAPASPSSDAVDIVGGDLGSGAKNLVVVLRLKSLAADTVTTTGATYTFAWSLAGTPQAVDLARYSDGTAEASFNPDTSFGSNAPAIPVGYVIDNAAGTITWSISRKSNALLKKKGGKFNAIAATARPSVNVNMPTGTFSSTVLNGDSASSPRTYVDSTPTCLKGV
jgi:hypothetical protein